MKMKDTEHLENAYSPFGNVAYVDHWFKADTLIGNMRPVVTNKTISISKKPSHFQRVYQLDFRPLERLSMDKIIDFSLVQRNGRYINLAAKTAYEVELMARKKKKNDWRIEIIDAFYTFIYQRQGRKKWLLIEIGRGYA